MNGLYASFNSSQRQSHFGIGYQRVSLLFIGAVCGYVTATLLVVKFMQLFGIGKVLAGGAVLQALGYIPIIAPLPFEAMIVGYVVIGFGLALLGKVIFPSTIDKLDHNRRRCPKHCLYCWCRSAKCSDCRHLNQLWCRRYNQPAHCHGLRLKRSFVPLVLRYSTRRLLSQHFARPLRFSAPAGT